VLLKHIEVHAGAELEPLANVPVVGVKSESFVQSVDDSSNLNISPAEEHTYIISAVILHATEVHAGAELEPA
jgi:hypothetical protein